MDILLSKDQSIYIAGKSAHLAVGPANDTSADVFFATTASQRTGKSSKIFSSAGEYEVQGVMVDGVATSEDLVSYHIIVDGVRIVALSLSKPKDLTEGILEKLQPADTVLLWLSEGTSEDIVSIFSRLEANYLIPVQVPVSIKELEKDLQLHVETTTKLKLSARDIADDKRALIILST